MAKCWHYETKDDKAKVTCPNCIYWNGERCRDEAMLIAEWDKEHGWAERMMESNRGVRID